MTRLAGSVSATQPLLDVLTNELFHQFGAVGFQKAAKRFLQHLVAAVEPSLLHKGINLAMQPLGDFGLNGFHDVRPTCLPRVSPPSPTVKCTPCIMAGLPASHRAGRCR